MFANLAKRLSALFVSTEEQERDNYLAASADFVDLNHRIQMLEMNHQPFTLYSSGAPRWEQEKN